MVKLVKTAATPLNLENKKITFKVTRNSNLGEKVFTQ